MATTINLTAAAYSRDNGSSWNSYSGQTFLNAETAYRFVLPANGAVAKPQTITVTYKTSTSSGSKSGTLRVYDSSAISGSTLLNKSISFPASSNEFTEKSEDLSTLSFSYTSCVVSFAFTATGVDIYLKDPVLTVELPDLQVSAAPSDLYTGDTLSLAFTNRLSQTLNVKFYNGSTELYSINANGDALNVTPDSSWFTTAGVSGDNMTVTVRASDSYGRTSTDVSFTLRKAAAGSVTLIAPKSTTVDGTDTIAFSWSYSGAGTLTKTELQWSYDNATWHDLTTINGSGTTYSVPGYTFNAGTVYWRGRATNSFGLRGEYPASGTSFTVGFPTLSTGVTPSQLYAGNSITLDFTNRLGQTISVNFYYNSTKLNSSPVTANSDSVTVNCPESWFTTAGVAANSMSVKAKATDSLGRTAADASFTLKRATGGSISPSAPRTSRFDGAEPIVFQWSYSGDGTLYTTYLQWSEDGENWHNLVTVPEGGIIKQIDALTFPAGTIYWRAKALNSLGVEGPWCNPVSFTVYYSATSQVVPSGTPTSGTIDSERNQVFTVALEASAPVYSPFLIQAAAFYWRAGYSGEYTELSMTPAADGLTASVTITGGTFPSGTIQWYAEATDNTGSTTLTDTYTLTSLNALIEAYPTSPINTIERGTGPIVFRWTYISLDSSPQNGAALEYSEEGSVWHAFGSVSGDTTMYTAPAGTLPGGIVYWRVRSRTQGGDWGPWSQAVSFQSFAAPIVLGVSATDVPVSVITWQVEGQLAFEIQVDDRRFGPYFGETVRRFVLPNPLPDGVHRVMVRAQNKYGLWSEWAENTVLTMNEPGAEIVLQGADAGGAVLTITTAERQGTFCIYRDGKLIGKTTADTYFDIRAVGTHQYYVMDVAETGYYTKSNTVEVTCPVSAPVIALLPNGPSLVLKLSEDANRSQAISREREVAYIQYAGTKYPEAEVGEHESLTVTGDVSFTAAHPELADMFESFLGKRVIYKTPGGLSVAGVLKGFQRRDPKHYKSYAFSVTQMDWEDFYDADSDILL